MRRIDPISFVATQLGTREVPNLGGIDDADDMTSLVQRARDAETIAPGGFQTGVNPSHPLGDQPIEEMAPSIRGVRKAPCAHLVAARHARVQRVFGNVDTQYPVDHCPILPPCLFSKSSASNNLVHRIYAHARPKIPSNLHSGAWKTGPNLPHGLIRQRDARGSPFSSQLSKMCLFAKQSATYKGRGLLPAPRTDPYLQLSRIRLLPQVVDGEAARKRNRKILFKERRRDLWRRTGTARASMTLGNC